METRGMSPAGRLLKDGSVDKHQLLASLIPKEAHGLPDPLTPRPPDLPPVEQGGEADDGDNYWVRSEEHTSELQSPE